MGFLVSCGRYVTYREANARCPWIGMLRQQTRFSMQQVHKHALHMIHVHWQYVLKSCLEIM